MKYDFVVVGAGPAGAAVASCLAKTSKAPSVLLLEAGGTNAELDARILADRYSIFMTYPHYNYGYQTVPQAHQNDRVLDFSRGRGLGGSSCINFAFYTIGPKDEYDLWAEKVEDEAFKWEHTRRRYNKIESYGLVNNKAYHHFVNPKKDEHGQSGPLSVEFPQEWERTFVDALEGGHNYGMPYNTDINSGDPIGLGVAPSTARKSVRCSSAVAYLQNAPSNLTIVTDSPATKILFDSDRAIGVIAGGKEYYANNEVIISAGAIDSPKLLMLSGIGPKTELEKHNIPVLQDLPVGQNMEDHPYTRLTLHLKPGSNDRPSLVDPAQLAKAKAQFEKDGTGPLSIIYNSCVMGFFKPSEEMLASDAFKSLPREAQERIMQPTVPAWELAILCPPLNPLANPAQSYLTVVLFLQCPQSRGSIRLASSNPADPPVCDPQFLTHAWDRTVFTEAVRIGYGLLTSDPLIKDAQSIWDAPKSTNDEDIWEHLKETTGTTYHMSCTVKMGKDADPEACVTSDFRVKGVKGLRVADMSVAPFVPSCHTMSTAYFIGETCAEKLIGEYGLDDGSVMNGA